MKKNFLNTLKEEKCYLNNIQVLHNLLVSLTYKKHLERRKSEFLPSEFQLY